MNLRRPPGPGAQSGFSDLVLPSDLRTLPSKELVDQAHRVGKGIAAQIGGSDPVGNNQFRTILDELIRLRARGGSSGADADKQLLDEVVLLKPRLAYAAARSEKLRPFVEYVSRAIDSVRDREGFDRLYQLVEAIVAYAYFERQERGGR